MKKAYILQLIDGGFDSTFIVLNEKEWKALPPTMDCEDPFFETFWEEEDKSADSAGRSFGAYSEVFEYVKKNKMTLVDGFSMCQY